jgi:hypothetical protein
MLKALVWIVVVPVLLVTLAISYGKSQRDDSASTDYTPSTSSVVDTDYEESSGITPDMVVDTLGPPTVQRFCRGYAVVGEAGFAAFDRSYTHADPSAREVFDEILSRC